MQQNDKNYKIRIVLPRIIKFKTMQQGRINLEMEIIIIIIIIEETY